MTDFPICLYDPDSFNPDNPEAGLLKGPLVVAVCFSVCRKLCAYNAINVQPPRTTRMMKMTKMMKTLVDGEKTY